MTELSQLYKVLNWKCKQVVSWKEKFPHSDFDTSFIEKMYKLIDQGEQLTSAQIRAVDNIYNSFYNKYKYEIKKYERK